MIIKIHNFHDWLFRNFLADIREAKIFLENDLPEKIKKHSVFFVLHFKLGFFVEKYRKYYSSIIFYLIHIKGIKVSIYMSIKLILKNKNISNLSIAI